MEQLYKKYSKLIYNYLYGLSKNREISEELTQETFYKAIKSIKSFRGDCKVNIWLCQIAKNLWRDYINKEKKMKFVSIEEDDYITNLLVDESVENDREDLITLYKQIHKLDEKTKEVFYLRIRGELTFKEIGEILGKTEEWARITFYRGKIRIKEEIKDDKE